VCSSEEMCSASLANEETNTQTTENFLSINVQELVRLDLFIFLDIYPSYHTGGVVFAVTTLYAAF